MVRRLKESNPYPANWTADTDIHQVFSTLDQTDTKNPGAIEDLYGFVEYDVGWVDGEEDIIQIRATLSGEGYGSYETFYVYPSYTKNVYLIDTEELGTRTVGNATDVWDIMSTCLRKQLKDTSSASVYEENKKGSFNMVRRLNEGLSMNDEETKEILGLLLGKNITDKELEKLVRVIIFGPNAVMDWKRVQKLMLSYMPELRKYDSYDELKDYLSGKSTKESLSSKAVNEDFDDEYGDEDDYDGQEDIVASYNVSYEEEDGSTYDDGGQFHICFNPYTEKYSWRSDALDMSSDGTFDTEEEAYEDAEYAHQPDDGSTLVIY